MDVICHDIPPALAAPLTEALALCALRPVQTGAAVLLLGTEDPAQALARIADFAASRPEAGRAGADRIASGQVVWLLPAGQAAVLQGTLARAALAHAPQLRVNAIHLAPRRPSAPRALAGGLDRRDAASGAAPAAGPGAGAGPAAAGSGADRTSG
ncbi:hypothetical protein ACTTAM_17330 [Rhodobacter capsulatus]|uniref:hypothetical protein n=1 Tax=Rhodobacter capsulatus TaxID=1061 RepID=UPI0040250703